MTRQARRSRPQLVCILADNSGSMRGPKAEAATHGIREMLMRCQSRGPRGRDRSYFRLVLIEFGDTAQVLPHCAMTPVRHIDPESISITGNGGGTNLTAALELAYDGLKRYLREGIENHADRANHPLPLLLVFSDGRNGYGKPEAAVERLKSLQIDGERIPIAVAGVSVDTTDKLDEKLLRRLASPKCYVHISHPESLQEFLANVGSSAASSGADLSCVIAGKPRGGYVVPSVKELCDAVERTKSALEEASLNLIPVDGPR